MRNSKYAGLFFLHINRCGGMTLLDMLRDKFPERQIYQCTSPVQNFWNGQPELLDIYNPFQLKVIFGHAVTEEMLKFFEGNALMVCPLREPVARLVSQAKFHVKLHTTGVGAMPVAEAFWEDNRNFIVRSIVKAFPTIAEKFATSLEAALFILSGFDVVYDVDSIDQASVRIFELLDLPPPEVLHSNGAVGVGEQIEEPREIAEKFLNEDLALYAAFAAARAKRPEADNPLWDATAAAALRNFGREEVRWHVLANRLAEYVASDLYNANEYNNAVAYLHRKMAFVSQVLSNLDDADFFARNGMAAMSFTPDKVEGFSVPPALKS
jgi:hypothetical protein